MKENILSYIFQITFLLQYYERTKRKKKWETMYRKDDEQSSAVRVVGSSIEIVNAGAHWQKVGFVTFSFTVNGPAFF